MDIILEKVEECKKDALYRLLQYSLFEESLSDQNDMNEDALFEYPWFEFMVLPKFRRNKIGKKAACACFERYPGNWDVSPAYGSRRAYLFWENVIDEYTGKHNQYEDGIFLFSQSTLLS